jgi:hypothetical protein
MTFSLSYFKQSTRFCTTAKIETIYSFVERVHLAIWWLYL